MAYELTFSELTYADTEEALLYYGNISTHLSDRFFNELLAAYETLTRNPQYYSFISSGRLPMLRDVKLPSFPYVVIYEIRETYVYVLSVMNCHKQPLNI